MAKKKTILILTVLLIFAVCLIALFGGNQTAEPGEGMYSSDTTSPLTIAPGGVLGPMLYVNDQIYYYHADSKYRYSELDERWSYIGSIQSQTSKYGELPTENFQGNHGLLETGSEVYHSEEEKIYFALDLGYDDEIVGDSIIVFSDGVYYQYITEEASHIIIDKKNAFIYSACLIINDTAYQRKASKAGDGFQIDDSYIFLGEVGSVVPRTERPTENFQTNLANITGGKVYLLPSDDESIYDILVLVRGDSRVYFSISQ